MAIAPMEPDDVDIDISDTDAAILELLEDGRITPSYAKSEIGKSRPHITNRLKRMVEHGFVYKVHRGLYELEDEYQE